MFSISYLRLLIEGWCRELSLNRWEEARPSIGHSCRTACRIPERCVIGEVELAGRLGLCCRLLPRRDPQELRNLRPIGMQELIVGMMIGGGEAVVHRGITRIVITSRPVLEPRMLLLLILGP